MRAISSLPAGPGWLLFLIVLLGVAIDLLDLWKDWPRPEAPPPVAIPGIDPDACWSFCAIDGLPVQSWEPHRCVCAPVRP